MSGERQLELLRDERPHPLEGLKRRVQQWAGRGVWFGASSWKYEGWLGQVYTRERYIVRGRLSNKRFEQHCLEEYALIFPSVCGDFSFYQFYSDSYWQRLFAQAPPSFQFGFKVPEVITAPSFPDHDRYGARRGQKNPGFLDAGLVRREFLDRLMPWRRQVGYLVFQFPQLSKAALADNGGFLSRLDSLLAALPDAFHYGIEVRNEALLGEEYFATLRKHRVGHVFNSWTRMPPIGQQLDRPGSITSDVVVSRVLLRPGRTYEQAVQSFQPYDQVKDPYPQGYRDVARLVRSATAQPGRKVFIAVNNRFVGNAPQAIEVILDELDRPAAAGPA
jgi:uncharacterized protein YecE (DUF72 family)